jgi:hypothetical protein
MNEPREIVAGDTASWVESFADYPASAGWALTYELRGATKMSLTASECVAAGDGFVVTIPASATDDWLAGWYAYQGYVTKSGVRHMVSSGMMEVKANLTAVSTAYTALSHARTCLAETEAAIARFLLQPFDSISIGNRTLTRVKIVDLVKLRDRYRYEVRQEEAAERIAKGLDAGNRILVRFGGITS